MKKLISTLIILIVSFGSTFSQSFVKQHMGKYIESYQGLLVTLDTTTHSLFRQFYNTPQTQEGSSDVAYPEKKNGYYTSKDSLKNRIFKVEEVATIRENILGMYGLLTLRDTATNQKLYYVYDGVYEHNFSLLSQPTKIKIDKEKLSKNISRKHDEIDNEISLSAIVGKERQIWIQKFIKSGKSTYYLSLYTNGSTLNYGGQGVTILFTDGTKWVRNVKVGVDYIDGWRYNSFIPLTSADLELFKTKTIKKYRLYIYDQEVSMSNSEELKQYVPLIITMK